MLRFQGPQSEESKSICRETFLVNKLYGDQLKNEGDACFAICKCL